MSHLLYTQEDGSITIVNNSENITIRIPGIEPVLIDDEKVSEIKKQGIGKYTCKDGMVYEKSKDTKRELDKQKDLKDNVK